MSTKQMENEGDIMYRLSEIKELCDCIPIPLTQSITYLREEKNDFYTFYSACEYTNELVTNKTALQILKLCNKIINWYRKIENSLVVISTHDQIVLDQVDTIYEIKNHKIILVK